MDLQSLADTAATTVQAAWALRWVIVTAIGMAGVVYVATAAGLIGGDQ